MAVQSFPDDVEVVRQAALLRDSLISRDVAEGHFQRIQALFAEEIRIHARRSLRGSPDEDLRAAVIGNAIGAALLTALKLWAARGSDDDLRDLVRRAVDLVRCGVGG